MGINEYLEVYKGKKVLITGHTGFKGSWLSIWLKSLGADVIGIALDPYTEKDNFVLSDIANKINDYRGDIRNLEAFSKIVEQEKPEILFHLAAQPLVLESYQNPVYTFETNILGTVNVLEAFRNSKTLATGVFITSDKCYENKEWVWGYRESDEMGGYDPYSSSKGAAELVINSYRNSFFKDNCKNIASARAGNVIGGGDWSPHRIVVDIISAIERGETIELRNPYSTRPWQHVLEPLGGYLLLGAKMMHEKGNYCEAWNFGPESSNVLSVENLTVELIKEFGKGEWIDKSQNQQLHEAGLLALDINKARIKLNWKPVLDFQETIKYTVDWYKRYNDNNIYDLCMQQIKNYTYKWNLRS